MSALLLSPLFTNVLGYLRLFRFFDGAGQAGTSLGLQSSSFLATHCDLLCSKLSFLFLLCCNHNKVIHSFIGSPSVVLPTPATPSNLKQPAAPRWAQSAFLQELL